LLTRLELLLDLAIATRESLLKPALDRFIELTIDSQVILRCNTLLRVVSILISNAVSEIL
jgi:hypothetical protein